CGCAACLGPLRKEIRRSTREGRDLTLIWGIGRKFAPALEALGVADYSDLITCEPHAIVAELRELGVSNLSTTQVKCWTHHAQTYRDAQPIIVGPPPPVGDQFIALDLEYDSSNRNIWLIGMYIVGGDSRDHVTLWADTPRQERRNLLELANQIA